MVTKTSKFGTITVKPAEITRKETKEGIITIQKLEQPVSFTGGGFTQPGIKTPSSPTTLSQAEIQAMNEKTFKLNKAVQAAEFKDRQAREAIRPELKRLGLKFDVSGNIVKDTNAVSSSIPRKIETLNQEIIRAQNLGLSVKAQQLQRQVNALRKEERQRINTVNVRFDSVIGAVEKVDKLVAAGGFNVSEEVKQKPDVVVPEKVKVSISKTPEILQKRPFGLESRQLAGEFKLRAQEKPKPFVGELAAGFLTRTFKTPSTVTTGVSPPVFKRGGVDTGLFEIAEASGLEAEVQRRGGIIRSDIAKASAILTEELDPAKFLVKTVSGGEIGLGFKKSTAPGTKFFEDAPKAGELSLIGASIGTQAAGLGFQTLLEPVVGLTGAREIDIPFIDRKISGATFRGAAGFAGEMAFFDALSRTKGVVTETPKALLGKEIKAGLRLDEPVRAGLKSLGLPTSRIILKGSDIPIFEREVEGVRKATVKIKGLIQDQFTGRGLKVRAARALGLEPKPLPLDAALDLKITSKALSPEEIGVVKADVFNIEGIITDKPPIIALKKKQPVGIAEDFKSFLEETLGTTPKKGARIRFVPSDDVLLVRGTRTTQLVKPGRTPIFIDELSLKDSAQLRALARKTEITGTGTATIGGQKFDLGPFKQVGKPSFKDPFGLEMVQEKFGEDVFESLKQRFVSDIEGEIGGKVVKVGVTRKVAKTPFIGGDAKIITIGDEISGKVGRGFTTAKGFEDIEGIFPKQKGVKFAAKGKLGLGAEVETFPKRDEFLPGLRKQLGKVFKLDEPAGKVSKFIIEPADVEFVLLDEPVKKVAGKRIRFAKGPKTPLSDLFGEIPSPLRSTKDNARIIRESLGVKTDRGVDKFVKDFVGEPSRVSQAKTALAIQKDRLVTDVSTQVGSISERVAPFAALRKITLPKPVVAEFISPKAISRAIPGSATALAFGLPRRVKGGPVEEIQPIPLIKGIDLSKEVGVTRDFAPADKLGLVSLRKTTVRQRKAKAFEDTLLGVGVRTTDLSISKAAEKLGVSTRTARIQQTKPAISESLISVLGTRIVPIEAQLEGVATRTRGLTRTTTRLAELQILAPALDIPIPVNETTDFPPLIPLPKKVRKPVKRKKPVTGFGLEVKRKGKFVRIFAGKSFSKKTVKRQAQQIVGGGVGASFRIVPAFGKRTAAQVGLPSFKPRQFRKPIKKGKSQLGSNVFIERNKFRIDTPGELRGITLKGIRAPRKKFKKTTKKRRKK